MCSASPFASLSGHTLLSGFFTRNTCPPTRSEVAKFFRTIVIVDRGLINGIIYVAGTYFGAKARRLRAKTDIRAYGTIPAYIHRLALPFAIANFLPEAFVAAHLAHWGPPYTLA